MKKKDLEPINASVIILMDALGLKMIKVEALEKEPGFIPQRIRGPISLKSAYQELKTKR